ncbi:MAG: pitrilysin family protein [Clostridium sp.]
MIKFTLENGMRIIYKKIEGNLSSFSISLEAGANSEIEEKIGVAHMVEHMIYKGTKNRTESEINALCDELLGFNNAMTNYPYVVYYGTSLSEDFEKSIDLYSDLIINPIFPKEGFKEEKEVICQELKEWKDDSQQFCEDQMLLHAFNNRRIKDLIIGTEESIKSISIYDVKEFYKKHYVSNNCVVSIVSSIDFQEVKNIIERYFSCFNSKSDFGSYYTNKESSIIYEKNNVGVYKTTKKDLQSVKIQYLFPIDSLNNKEIKALRIFNEYFGEGTSGFLYDEIRTKRGLAYDISTTIKNEKGIKLYKISLGTSTENIDIALEIIDNKIKEVMNLVEVFSTETIKKLVKSIILKRSLKLEKSIYESVYLANYEIMYGEENLDGKINYDYIPELQEEINHMEDINDEIIESVIKKILVNPTIEILTKG